MITSATQHGELLHVERIDSFARMMACREEWEELVRRESRWNLYVSFTMCKTWLEATSDPGSLFLLLVRRGGELVGCAPMVLREKKVRAVPRRVLSFLIPRGDFIIAGARAPVIQAIVDYWDQVSDCWDLIWLEDLPDDSGSLRHI